MKKIILVEDSFLLRRELKALLKGFKIYATHDPHQALELLDRHRADWLIINPLLAKNSGLELLYEINTWPDLRVKVILLTADQSFFQRHWPTLRQLNVKLILPLAAGRRLLHFLKAA